MLGSNTRKRAYLVLLLSELCCINTRYVTTRNVHRGLEVIPRWLLVHDSYSREIAGQIMRTVSWDGSRVHEFGVISFIRFRLCGHQDQGVVCCVDCETV
jgi:hypothetical protein